MPEEKSELVERGNEIFDRLVRPQVDVEEDAQKFVAIDVETEDVEIDRNARAAFDRLVERHPDARGRTWLRRVGSRSAYHFGGRLQEAGKVPMYDAEAVLAGPSREVFITEAPTTPLVGTGLLWSFSLYVEFQAGGTVEVAPLPDDSD